jgi:chromosome segregation ATPase
MDEYPAISLEQYIDSTNSKLVYLSGNMSDDYGISKIQMVQQIRTEDGKLITRTITLPKPTAKQGFYSYLLDIDALQLKPGSDLSYYFEVFDNDGTKGPKSSKTNALSFKKPSVKQLEKNIDQSTKEIQSELEKTLKESKKINDAIQKLRDKLLQQKSLNWQDKEQLSKLLEKQQQLQEQLQKTQEKLEQKRNDEQEIKQPNPEIQEKQQKLDEMLKELQNPEEQKLMDKIKELMDKLDKKESINQLEKMSQQNEQQNKSLDRLMELMKQLELESKVQDQVKKLNELAEKQEKLAEQTEKKQKDQEQLKKEQEQIKKDFEDVQKKMDEIQKENKELNAPKKLDDQKEEQQQTEQDLKKAQDQLDKKDNQNASKSQKSASKKMKQMAQNMENDMAASEKEQIELDMKAVRQLLENIIGLSFNQENLINQYNATMINTPKYVSLNRDQKKIKSDFKMVDDSLVALSKRVIQIESFILKKVGEVNDNLNQTMDNLEDRNKPLAANTQQHAMTSLNDLALMLSEALNQMQMQAQSMPGSGTCTKPGGSNPSSGTPSKKGEMPQMDKISQGQQKMTEEMKNQMGKMKDGKSPGSENFGQMAAQQAKVRKMLQDLDAQMKSNGQGKKQIQDIIDAMDQIEKDLVNRRLTNEMLRRQQDIMVRLLEEERAQKEQDKDEQRKANQALQQQSKIPPSMQEYIRKKEAGIDDLRPVYPTLTPYYKRLVEQYYNQLSGK